MNTWAPIIAAAVSAAISIVVCLVAWGWRGEIRTLRAENGTLKAEMLTAIQKAVNSFATIPGQIATIRAENRATIAESVNDFYKQINGNYTKKDLHNTLVARVDGLEARVNDLGD